MSKKKSDSRLLNTVFEQMEPQPEPVAKPEGFSKSHVLWILGLSSFFIFLAGSAFGGWFTPIFTVLSVIGAIIFFAYWLFENEIKSFLE